LKAGKNEYLGDHRPGRAINFWNPPIVYSSHGENKSPRLVQKIPAVHTIRDTISHHSSRIGRALWKIGFFHPQHPTAGWRRGCVGCLAHKKCNINYTGRGGGFDRASITAWTGMNSFLLSVSSNHFLFKLTLAPIIIALATLIAWRWGERIGGIIVGLPLTSAPVSLFFALEQGRQFASNAAKGAMIGVIPVAAFCTGYALSSRRLPWVGAALISAGLYLVCVIGVSYITLDLVWMIGIIMGVLLTAILLIGHPASTVQTIKPLWWDLPSRMLVAAIMLLLITSLAGMLGPTWSGLLSPFPIFTFVMASFSHSQGGASSAWKVIRGVLVGLFSYLAFFLVVNLMVVYFPLWLVYSIAAIVALGINGASLVILVRKQNQTI